MRVLVGDGAKKTNLLPVAPAPTAHEQMEFETDALAKRQRLLNRDGLKAADLAAGGPKRADSRVTACF